MIHHLLFLTPLYVMVQDSLKGIQAFSEVMLKK